MARRLGQALFFIGFVIAVFGVWAISIHPEDDGNISDLGMAIIFGFPLFVGTLCCFVLGGFSRRQAWRKMREEPVMELNRPLEVPSSSPRQTVREKESWRIRLGNTFFKIGFILTALGYLIGLCNLVAMVFKWIVFHRSSPDLASFDLASFFGVMGILAVPLFLGWVCRSLLGGSPRRNTQEREPWRIRLGTALLVIGFSVTAVSWVLIAEGLIMITGDWIAHHGPAPDLASIFEVAAIFAIPLLVGWLCCGFLGVYSWRNAVMLKALEELKSGDPIANRRNIP